MSKLSFRARALDANKSLPVYHAEDVPDLPDIASVNRVVPQMPTGMEKEEETEHHLQRAISAQQIYGEAQRLIIPTPDAILYESDYKQLKKRHVVMPKQLIHVQAFTLEDELPDYDCDEEDNRWLLLYNKRNPKDTISIPEFESIIDTLEKGCSSRVEPESFQLFTLKDAHALLKRDGKIVDACFEYWKKKRELAAATLAPPVRTEKKDGSTLHDPYVAFRRRVEKMQTRKNRKNDEASYEKMLALRRDLKRACLILEMVKLREEQKRNLLDTTIKVLETRYSNKDFQGELLHQCYDLLKQRQLHPSSSNNSSHNSTTKLTTGERSRESMEDRLKRSAEHEERKRHGAKMPKPRSISTEFVEVDVDSKENIPISMACEEVMSKETATPRVQKCASRVVIDLDPTLTDGPDGKYSFRRRKGVIYHAPRYDSMGNWPWTHPVEGGSADPRYCYCCTSIQKRCHCIGFARRRVGRGGRVMFDRAYTPYDDYLSNPLSKLKSEDSVTTINGITTSFPDRVPPWPHFKPCIDSSDDDETNTSHREANSWTHKENTTNSDFKQNFNKPLLHRTFSSQPTSKFRIHPYPSRSNQTRNSSINNQVFIASLAASLSKNTDSQHWVPKKSRNNHNPINGTIFTSPIKFHSAAQHVSISPSRPASTAPSSTVYQLNFPIIVSSKSNSSSPSDNSNKNSCNNNGSINNSYSFGISSNSCSNPINCKNNSSKHGNNYINSAGNSNIVNKVNSSSNNAINSSAKNYKKHDNSNSDCNNGNDNDNTNDKEDDDDTNNDKDNENDKNKNSSSNSNSSSNNNNDNNDNNDNHDNDNNNSSNNNNNNNDDNNNNNNNNNNNSNSNNNNSDNNHNNNSNSSNSNNESTQNSNDSNQDSHHKNGNSNCNTHNHNNSRTSNDNNYTIGDGKYSGSGSSSRNNDNNYRSSNNSRRNGNNSNKDDDNNNELSATEQLRHPTVTTTCVDISRTQIQGVVSQPILRQPINIVKQSYVTQKLLAQLQTGGVQISSLPVSNVRTNKLSIPKGLNISHSPVVTNGITSSAGIQLAR